MSERKKTSRMDKARSAVRLAVVVLVIVGLCVCAGWGTVCIAGVDSIAAICPLGALESLLAARTGVPRLIIAAACALVIVALFGRTFCAWVCPVPPIGRFFHPGKRGKAAVVDGSGATGMNAAGGGRPACDTNAGFSCDDSSSGDFGRCLPSVGGKRDGIHLDPRHAVLVGALASSAVFGFPVFCLVCPVGLTFATIIALWGAIVGHSPTWALLVFPLILVLELVVFRKWCHVLCPMGALMSLVGAKAPIGKPRVCADACLRTQGVDCRACVETCPEELDPHSAVLAECTRCGRCVENCPGKAISMRPVSGRKHVRGSAMAETGHADGDDGSERVRE